MILAAKEKRLKSIAITDHGHAHGHADFYLLGKKHGVRTVFGVEAYVIGDLDEWTALKEVLDSAGEMDVDEDTTNDAGAKIGRVDKRELRRKGHLVLLACDRTGLSNLYRLIYESHKRGFYGKPRMDKKMLAAGAQGLVASSACMGGVVSNKCWELQRGACGWDEVVEEARSFDRIFGRGRFFLELQFNESEAQRYINSCMARLHGETGIPLTVTTDSHYTRPEEWEAQEILYMLRGKKTIATRGDDWKFEIRQLYIKSPEEMWRSYEQFGTGIDERTAIGAFQNTLLVDSLVADYEPDTRQRLPTLPYADPFAEMGRRAIDGLKKLGLVERDEYRARLLHELSVIKKKGFASYFLVTQRMIEEAKKRMLVGAGRGSSAGSLVCYALGITDLDPIAHGLMFERFMDESRTEMPDIDVDFQDVDETKEMLRRMFGEDNVACLSTYGTFQIKGLLKDLARVYDLDHVEVNRVNKKIDSELRQLYVGQDKSTIVIKLEDVERVSPTFNRFVELHPRVGEHLKKLYGRNRHVGRHASGVIIGDDLPGETAVFTAKGDDGRRTVQASFTEGIVNKNLSAMGFIKFDVLSIATLKIIDHALRLVAARSGRPYDELRESIRPHRMDLDDSVVLKKIFRDGNFAGVFQFTEKGIRRVAQNIEPDSFEDVVAVCALYRPGPLGSGMHKIYAENKRLARAGELRFEHPILEEIMRSTYGCLIYQEQMLQMGSKLGRLGGKDTQRLRKLFLKKDKSKTGEFLSDEAKELKEKFLVGCRESGWERGEESWAMMEKFGGYGFNKAHSAAYSVMTMQCAHLATYHPLEFYSAVLTKGQAGEMQEYVSDIKKRGIKILPVDVNASKGAHVIEGDAVRLSLSSVLGVGPAAIGKIVAGQPYSGFLDFLDRSGASKTAVHPLVLVGAFASLPDAENVKWLEGKYEAYAENPKLKTKKMRPELLRLWADPPPSAVPDYEPHEKVFWENSLMGFSLRGSPFEILDRKKKIEALFSGVVSTRREFLESELETAVLPVVVKEARERAQRRGGMMAFVKFETIEGEEFEAPCFSSLWRWLGPKVRKGGVYVATFNRRLEEPEDLIVGRPGFAHTQHSALGSFIDVDEIKT